MSSERECERKRESLDIPHVEFAAPQVGKGGMNPWLSAANWSNIIGKEWGVCKDTKTARLADKHLGCSDAPGFGSGITWNPCGEKVPLVLRRDSAARGSSARVCSQIVIPPCPCTGVHDHGPRPQSGRCHSAACAARACVIPAFSHLSLLSRSLALLQDLGVGCMGNSIHVISIYPLSSMTNPEA